MVGFTHRTCIALVCAVLVLFFQNCEELGIQKEEKKSEAPPIPVKNIQLVAMPGTTVQGRDVEVKIELNEASARDLVLEYETVDGTAVADTEYEKKQGVLLVPAGVTSVPLVIRTYSFELNTVNKFFNVNFELITEDSDDVFSEIDPNTQAEVKWKEKYELIVRNTTATIERQVNVLANFQSISVGEDHSCGLDAAGKAHCWGSSYGGSATNKVTPAEIAGIENAKAIASGDRTSCVINADNQLQCWSSPSRAVSLINNLDAVSAVAVQRQICVITGNETQCMNTQGGQRRTISNLVGAKQLSVGAASEACAITANDQVACFSTTGPNNAFQLVPDLNNIKQVTVGRAHKCVINVNDTVSCWGSGTLGQLGQDLNQSNTPVLVQNLANIKYIDAGADHTCAVDANDSIRCWGAGTRGQLGNGAYDNSFMPVLAAGANNAQVLDSSSHETCMVGPNGQIKCWGQHGENQLSTHTRASTLIPTDKSVVANIKSTATNGFYSCLINVNNQLECWGRLTQDTDKLESPQLIQGANNISQVDIGRAFMCVLDANGAVFCMGNNEDAQMAQPDDNPSFTELTRIENLPAASQISTGSRHACAITAQGVYCWGRGSSGERGPVFLQENATPNLVANTAGAKQVTTGAEHSCIINANDTVSCWGSNLGNVVSPFEDNSIKTQPTLVAGLENIQQIASGETFNCTLDVAGAVRCWGAAGSGQLGDNNVTGQNGISNVTGLNAGVKQISAASSQACAIDANNNVQCWGAGGSGAHGNRKADINFVPVQMSEATNVQQVDVGVDSAVILNARGVRQSGEHSNSTAHVRNLVTY